MLTLWKVASSVYVAQKISKLPFVKGFCVQCARLLVYNVVLWGVTWVCKQCAYSYMLLVNIFPL